MRIVSRTGLETSFFLLPTVAGLYVVLAIIRGRRRPYTTVGCACKADLSAAVAKALDEAVSIRAVCDSFPNRGSEPRRTSRLEDHASLYADWREPVALDPWWARPTVDASALVRFRRIPERYDELQVFAQELAVDGLTMLYAEVTPPDVSQFGHVVRVILPEAVPLSQSSNVRWLGTPRLRRALGEREPVSFAHPFA